MQKAQAAIAGTLILAVALGTIATIAIKRAAGRRAVLATEVAARLPEIPGSRLVAPWTPNVDADQAHATYCLDDADPAAAAARFVTALTGAGWSALGQRPDRAGTAIGVELTGWGYRLRGTTAPGTRSDCVGARRQMALTAEVARASYPAPP